MDIRSFTPDDSEYIWEIFQTIAAEGDAFVQTPEDLNWEQMVALWSAPKVHIFVATEDENIVGAYILKPNFEGRGAHVANGTYLVAPEARGKKIGRALGEHSIETARALGYRAMQFNCVVSTNEAAVALWKNLGFEIIGTVPQGFDHSTLGPVDFYIMHRLI